VVGEGQRILSRPLCGRDAPPNREGLRCGAVRPTSIPLPPLARHRARAFIPRTFLYIILQNSRHTYEHRDDRTYA
ncbi:hypothetical protein HAX54_050882, partial [Datura stramonium]|nr:hypothetical protein [Datura stramonium]